MSTLLYITLLLTHPTSHFLTPLNNCVMQVEDAELLALLSSSLKPRKSSKKKTAAKAEKAEAVAEA